MALLLLSGSVLVACSIPVHEGYFSCDPNQANSCPEGWLCQVRGESGTPYCYKNEGPHCGDGELATDEVCDGLRFRDTFECISGQRLCSDYCVATCTVCGDGVREFNSLGEGEECDDGNTTDHDGCSALCTVEGLSACGNNVVEYGEACDDGNTLSGDGCTADCRSDESCGNGIQDAHVGESCDGTHLGDARDCTDLGYHGGQLTCGDGCELNVTLCEPYGRCGDGAIQLAHEDCDGNELGGETCSSIGYYGGELSCTSECAFGTSGCVPFGYCGDGLVQTGHEVCDGTNLGTHSTCTELGYNGGVVLCLDCQLELSNCEASGRCGNGVREPPYEACDDMDLGGETCTGLGFYGGALWCAQNCQPDLTNCLAYGWCGDGLVQAGAEACDGTNLGGSVDCGALGYYGGGSQVACQQSTCQYDVSLCAPHGHCGDGVIQSEHEDCDGANLGAVSTCEDLGYYGGGTGLTCGNDCRYDVASCETHGWCGDGIAQPAHGEQCDDRDLNGTSCVDRGYTAGSLYCYSDCTFHETACHPNPTRIGVGGSHTCYVDPAGDGWCWGANDHGQLGTGLGTNEQYPTPVAGGHTWMEISAAGNYTCALDTAGSAWCWGEGQQGNLGVGDQFTDYSTPMAVVGGHAFSKIATGPKHACALESNGLAWCWGRNYVGSLGTFLPVTSSATPLAVEGGNQFRDIDVGLEHTCAVDIANKAWCWGHPQDGRMGCSVCNPPSGFPEVYSVEEFERISAGAYHSAGTTVSWGFSYLWGNNDYGQLGIGNVQQSDYPAGVPFRYSVISAGNDITCAIDIPGVTWCWGRNESPYALGVGAGHQADCDPPETQNCVLSAQRVQGNHRFVSVVTSSDTSNDVLSHICALDQSERLWCWGRGAELGSGTTEATIPTEVVP